MKTALLVLFIPFLSFAYSLNEGRGFDKNKIDIHVANTDCSNAGFSTSRFRDLMEDAVEDYWNNIPTANLELNVKSVGSTDIAGMDHADIFAAGLVPAHSILAGCNEDAFSADDSGVLGGAQLICSGSTCRAVLIINSRPDSLVSTIDTDQKIATIAHELGHAIGLGHTEFSHNLMYYKIGGKHQKWLGQDDIDGVTYLYPYEDDDAIIGGCGIIPPLIGSMGTIKDIGKGNGDKQGPSAFFAMSLGGFLLVCLLSFLARRRPYLFKGFNSFPSK